MRRWLGFAGDVVRANVGRSVPFKLTYIVTDECSCRCAICHLWQDPRRGASLDEIRALFRANSHLSWINLSGGEVVEHESFGEITEAAVRSTRALVLDFPTAGQRPEETERRVRELLRLPIPRVFITVSIDGPPDVHDRLRGTGGAFERAADTFQRLLRLRSRHFQVYAGMTISSRNDENPDGLVHDLLAAAPWLPRERLHFNVAHHAPHYYRNRAGDAPDPRRTASFLRREREGRRGRGAVAWVERAYWRLADRYLESGASPIPCNALGASAYVDPDLRLYPCATWDRPLVDLREYDYSITRATRAADAIVARRDARAGRCPGCWTPCEAYPTILSQIRRTHFARTDRAADEIAR